MKSVVIVFVAVLMLVRPLWPVAEYIANYDYIANVLCENKNRPQLKCNGTCYLSRQLAKESKESQKNPFGENRTIDMPQILDTAFDLGLALESVSTHEKKAKFGHVQNMGSFLFVFKIIHPPETL